MDEKKRLNRKSLHFVAQNPSTLQKCRMVDRSVNPALLLATVFGN